MSVTITQAARQELERQGVGSEKFVRLSVKPGGCAGMTYEAEIDSTMAADEFIAKELDGIRIVTNESGQVYLDGLQIDFSDDLVSAGFQFSNSNSQTSCGCGASFALAGFPTMSGGSCEQ